MKTFTVRGFAVADDQDVGAKCSTRTEETVMAMMIALMILFGLTLALAQQKSQSAFRPRGRFAPDVAWGRLPAMPQIELAERTRARASRPVPARA